MSRDSFFKNFCGADSMTVSLKVLFRGNGFLVDTFASLFTLRTLWLDGDNGCLFIGYIVL